MRLGINVGIGIDMGIGIEPSKDRYMDSIGPI
jgi:hypothetical protein